MIEMKVSLGGYHQKERKPKQQSFGASQYINMGSEQVLRPLGTVLVVKWLRLPGS